MEDERPNDHTWKCLSSLFFFSFSTSHLSQELTNQPQQKKQSPLETCPHLQIISSALNKPPEYRPLVLRILCL